MQITSDKYNYYEDTAEVWVCMHARVVNSTGVKTFGVVCIRLIPETTTLHWSHVNTTERIGELTTSKQILIPQMFSLISNSTTTPKK